MHYYVCALMPEARPLIDTLRLKRTEALPWPLFVGDNALLIIGGIGQTDAQIATAALLGWRRPSAEDLLINLGICAAPEAYRPGELILAHELRYDSLRRYPDILFNHGLREVSLTTVDVPMETPLAYPADMESFGIYRAAERFFEAHQMLFFKLVSDHFTPHTVKRTAVPAMIEKVLASLQQMLSAADQFTRPSSLFSPQEQARLTTLAPIFTKSQFDTLLDACRYYRLKHTAAIPQEITAPQERPDKKERSRLLERFIARLTV